MGTDWNWDTLLAGKQNDAVTVETAWQFLKKSPREMKTCVHKETWTRMWTAALFNMATRGS